MGHWDPGLGLDTQPSSPAACALRGQGSSEPPEMQFPRLWWGVTSVTSPGFSRSCGARAAGRTLRNQTSGAVSSEHPRPPVLSSPAGVGGSRVRSPGR